MAPSGLSRIVRDLAPDASSSEDASEILARPAFDAIVRIVELQLRHVPLDPLTAEVLPAMLAIFDAPAGALLLYRREDATLTLAAARGLEVAGAEALEVLRWGDERTSEMPLRALVDRKVYVVERPDDDPFIRRLVGSDQRRPVTTVAAVPLYRWHLPVGVLLVFGSTEPLTSEALLAPTFAYSVLALALSNLLWARDDRGATPLPAPESAPPPLVCVPWIDLRERDAADRGRDTRPKPARDEDRAALETMLVELRGVVARMEAERQETARERNALSERLASFEHEHHRLAAQLETTEHDRNLLASRLTSLEETLTNKLAALVAAPRETTPPPIVDATPAPPSSPAPPRSAAPPAAGAKPTSATPPPPAPAEGISATPGAATESLPSERRVLETDPVLREKIAAALASAVPLERGSLAVANLLDCDADRIAAMADASSRGMLIVGYAAHAERGSRILGPVRCFATPPSTAEIGAAVESAGRGNRRTILLTEDIDGFMGAKAALVKAGHSVSMACDEKQALDLLAILRPDTVLIDVRSVAQPIEFLDALGPETGRVLTMLVHGEPTGAALTRVAQRMLRPPALDVAELAKVCRNALPDPKRAAVTPAHR